MSERSELYDLAIIGGGIVGLAFAYEITRRQPALSVVLLEKEQDIACRRRPTLTLKSARTLDGVINS